VFTLLATEKFARARATLGLARIATSLMEGRRSGPTTPLIATNMSRLSDNHQVACVTRRIQSGVRRDALRYQNFTLGVVRLPTAITTSAAM
jgi:hypothetical protein